MPSWQVSAPLVAGMDGYRSGWILVVTSAEECGVSVVSVASEIKEAIALLDAGQLAAVALGIPIGLPTSGPRTCDVAARRLLGPRHSSVFPVPVRSALGSTTYEEASAATRAASGKAMLKQTFAIMRRVEAVDSLMTPERQDTLIAVHPEVSFTVLAGQPMAHHKTTQQGRTERLSALRGVFLDVDKHLDSWFPADTRLPGSRPDHLLDAYVAAWSARRWVNGTYQRLGGEVDERGLRMEIIA